MRSLVMSDVETNSEWSHLLGKAMAGPLAGKTLKPLITDMGTWSVWKKMHPNTTVLNMSKTSEHYTKDFYGDPSRFVFGFEVNGQAWMLPMQEMMSHRVHQFMIGEDALLATFDADGAVTHLFDPRLDGKLHHFSAVDATTMTDRETKSTWQLTTGKAVDGPLKGKLLEQRVGIMSYLKAWTNFHPDSKRVSFK